MAVKKVDTTIRRPNIETEFTHEQVEEFKKCATDPVYFIKNYVKTLHPVKGQIPFDLRDYQIEMIKAYQNNKYCVVLASRQTGKALALTERIPTPTGWSTMGDLQVGDQVIGDDGKATTILAVSDVMHDRVCYRVNFLNGSSIVADAEHLWKVSGKVCTTQELSKKLLNGTRLIIDAACSFQLPGHIYKSSKPHHITSIQPVDSVPVKCIAVDNHSKLFLVGDHFIPTHNSVVAGAYLLWYASFNFDKTVLIASNHNANAMEMIYRIQKMYEGIPYWLKPGVPEGGWNKHAVEFDNGSRLLSQATTENTGRGLSISKLFFDEIAFSRRNLQERLWASISPTLATGGELIMSSTPNGDDDLFAEIWRGAEAGTNGFKSVFVPWDAPPDRDEEFKRKEIAKIGELRWRQEYLCHFVSSQGTLFDSTALQRIQEELKQYPATKYTVKPNDEEQTYDVNVWGDVRPYNAKYLVAVDPATGTDSDFSTITVFEHPSMVQMAEFRSNTIQTTSLYKLLKSILVTFEGRGANEVFYTFENNGIGEGLAALYNQDPNPSISTLLSDDGSNKVGFRTGKGKVVTCMTLKAMVESGRLKIRSMNLVKEMKSYSKSRTSYAALPGGTDDLISGCLLIIKMLEAMSSYDDDAFQQLYKSEADSSWNLQRGGTEVDAPDTCEPPPMIL